MVLTTLLFLSFHVEYQTGTFPSTPRNDGAMY